MSQSEKIVRVEMEHSDGRVQSLYGDEANQWFQEVNQIVIGKSLRYGRPAIKDFHWKWTTIRSNEPPK